MIEPIVPIYKVYQLKENSEVDKIHVFCGENPSLEDLESLFSNAPMNQPFLDPTTKTLLFSAEEITNIRDQSTPVGFVKQCLFADDTLSTVKMKIALALENTLSIDEIYLFCRQRETFTTPYVYQILTQRGKLSLTPIRLQQFLKNLLDESGDPVSFELEEGEVGYDYNTLLSLNLEKEFTINKPLGQKFFLVENEYPFVANPFQATEYD